MIEKEQHASKFCSIRMFTKYDFYCLAHTKENAICIAIHKNPSNFQSITVGIDSNKDSQNRAFRLNEIMLNLCDMKFAPLVLLYYYKTT